MKRSSYVCPSHPEYPTLVTLSKLNALLLSPNYRSPYLNGSKLSFVYFSWNTASLQSCNKFHHGWLLIKIWLYLYMVKIDCIHLSRQHWEIFGLWTKLYLAKSCREWFKSINIHLDSDMGMRIYNGPRAARRGSWVDHHVTCGTGRTENYSIFDRSWPLGLSWPKSDLE